jgi:basic membrane protein A
MMIVIVTGVLIFISPNAFSQDINGIELKGVDRSSLNRAHRVNVPSLNFRADPSLTTEPVSVVLRDAFLLETDRVFNQSEGIEWVKVIRGDGREGWVSSRHIRPVSDALATVESAAAFLNSLNSVTTTSATPAIGPLKELDVGFMYPAPVGDAGWSFSHDAGRLAMAKLPFVRNTSYIDSLPEDPELVSAALDQLVAEGKNLIFGASYGYMDPMMEAAQRYPDVVFMHNSGFKTQPNAGTYFGRIYEARYLSGIVAGAMTKSNIVGFVAAFPIPEVIRGINAFTLGAQSVNPEIQVKVEWTKTWYGPGIERAKAELLLDQDADVIAIHQDSPSAVQAAAQRGKYAIGFHSDMSVFGPEATLTSAVWDWSVVYKQIALELRQGVWDPEQLWWGLDKGVVGLTPISDKVPDDIKAFVEQRSAEIASRQLHIFEGPIRDEKGDIRVPSGTMVSDADLLTMDYYVLGVEGGIDPVISTVSNEGEAE